MKWSLPVEVPLPSPNSPLDVTQLADGRVLAVYNHGIGQGRPRACVLQAVMD